MKTIALIPARIGATRFPRKMMALIKGKTVIQRTFESARSTGLFDQVVVVTDSEEIKAEIESVGGMAVMSKRAYESGTDRIAEVAQDLEADVFVNVQGDEPFVQRAPLAQLLNLFVEAPDTQVASLAQPFHDLDLVQDPNFVKVVLDRQNNALLFSRSPIPYPRNQAIPITYYEHIGVYAFRKQALMQFTALEMTPLELAEKIECLRFLENGIPIKISITQYKSVEIDMPEDIARAEALMEQNNWI